MSMFKDTHRAPQGKLKHAAKMLGSLTGALADRKRSERLFLHFPSIKRRLDRVLAKAVVEPEPLVLATRHLLCAEALVEVLERKLENSIPPEKISSEQLMRDYTLGVAEKLRDFHKRSAAERRRIADTYPEVNLRYVLRGCEKGILEWEAAASALEESREYDILMRRLNRANLLD